MVPLLMVTNKAKGISNKATGTINNAKGITNKARGTINNAKGITNKTRGITNKLSCFVYIQYICFSLLAMVVLIDCSTWTNDQEGIGQYHTKKNMYFVAVHNIQLSILSN